MTVEGPAAARVGARAGAQGAGSPDVVFARGTCLIRGRIWNAILMRLKGNEFILKEDIVFCRDLRKHSVTPRLCMALRLHYVSVCASIVLRRLIRFIFYYT